MTQKEGEACLDILFHIVLIFENMLMFSKSTHMHPHTVRMQVNFKMKYKQIQMNQTLISFQVNNLATLDCDGGGQGLETNPSNISTWHLYCMSKAKTQNTLNKY